MPANLFTLVCFGTILVPPSCNSLRMCPNFRFLPGDSSIPTGIPSVRSPQKERIVAPLFRNYKKLFQVRLRETERLSAGVDSPLSEGESVRFAYGGRRRPSDSMQAR